MFKGTPRSILTQNVTSGGRLSMCTKDASCGEGAPLHREGEELVWERSIPTGRASGKFSGYGDNWGTLLGGCRSWCLRVMPNWRIPVSDPIKPGNFSHLDLWL